MQTILDLHDILFNEFEFDELFTKNDLGWNSVKFGMIKRALQVALWIICVVVLGFMVCFFGYIQEPPPLVSNLKLLQFSTSTFVMPIAMFINIY